MLDDEPNSTIATEGVGSASAETPAAAPTRRRRAPAKKTAAAPPSGDTGDASATDAGAPVAPAAAPRKRAAKKTVAAVPPAGPAEKAAELVQAAEPVAAKAPAKRTTRGRTAKVSAATAIEAGAEPVVPGASEAAHPVAAPAIPTVLFRAPQPDVAPPPARRERVRRPDALAGADGGVGVEEAVNAGDEPASIEGESGEREGSRRRRRGGRGRRGHGEGREPGQAGQAGQPGDGEGATGSDAAASSAVSADADTETAGEDHDREGEGHGESEESASSRRRRRRRRRGNGPDGEEHAPDDPPNTVVRIREPRDRDERDDRSGVQGVKGSTRLEAKKQRRREGREQIRRGRRGLVITEAEFLARRESVDRVMVVRQRGERTQIGVVEDGILVEHFVSTASTNRMVGNVYLGRVQNVLPGMEAAFVDIGKGRNAVLYAGEVNFDTSGIEGQPRRIESALKSGQTVLVQVTKDPIGHKGARLTSQVSLPGRYLVYVPEGSMMGISRKLPDVERSRLKAILKKVTPEGAGVIVRTAAEGASEEELARDIARLSAQWEDIKKKSETANAPTLLYGEPDLTIRVIRDVFNEDFNSLVVQADSEWDTVEAYVGHVAPDLVSRLSRWTSDEDIFTHYRIDEQIAKALDRKVWLPSGGYLVIDRTEAMIVIDVNTGRFIGKGGNLEETVTKNNLEAAEEIVRQLRLRDIGGIIVIDFIDMVLESNRELVLRRLVECLGRDRTKHQVAEVTSLGLVQMTRKRVGNGLLEAFSETCETCNGRGVIVHTDLVEQRSSRQGGPAVKSAPAGPVKPAPPRGGRGKRPAAEAAQAAQAAEAAEAAEASVAAVAASDGAPAAPAAPGGAAPGEPALEPAVGSANGADQAATGQAATGSVPGSGGSRNRRGGRRRGGSKAGAGAGAGAGAAPSETSPETVSAPA